VAGLLVLALAAALGAAAALLLAGSLVSYGSVKERLDSFASDGDAELSPADFDAAVVRLRVAAVLALAAGALVVRGRRRLRDLLLGLYASAAAEARALRGALAGAVAGTSALHLGALGLVTLAGVLVRVEFLAQPMRYDEAGTFVHYASQPWWVSLTTYTAPNNHILHSFLVHVSTGLFGSDPWAVRLPAFLAGVLLAPATYAVARLLYDRHVGLLAAGLVASASVLVEYSTNARGYTIVALVFLACLALATHLRSSAGPAAWLAFAVLGAIGLFTVPVMLYAYGAVALWLALSILAGGDRRLLARRLAPALVAAGVFAGILYLPAAAASGVGALVSNEFVSPQSFSYVAGELPDSVARVAEGWSRDLPLPFAAALAAAFAAGVLFHGRVARLPVAPALAAAAWVVPLLFAQRVVPFERVWLFLLPLYLMTASAGAVLALRALDERWRGRLVAVAAVAAAASLAGTGVSSQAVYRSEDTSTFRDARRVTALLERQLGPADAVLVWPPADLILEYELLRQERDPASLLYWERPPSRLFVVVKEGPRDYTLAELLADPRLPAGVAEPELLESFGEASVWELRLGAPAGR
jgi:hypothetical protein